MVRVLVTGMSGSGKSTVLTHLAALGHRVVDTDTDEWSRWTVDDGGAPDWVWREEAITDLLTTHDNGMLFVAGCKTNQGLFYGLFDQIVLLTAPPDVLLARVSARTTNDYGKDPPELALIRQHIAEVEPLLRRTAGRVIDTSAPVDEVVRELQLLGRKVD